MKTYQITREETIIYSCEIKADSFESAKKKRQKIKNRDDYANSINDTHRDIKEKEK